MSLRSFQRFVGRGLKAHRVAALARTPSKRYRPSRWKRSIRPSLNSRAKYFQSFPRKSLTWRGDSFMPEVFYTSFKYNSSFNDTDADGFHGIVYRGNSLYDPDAGAGGDYPLGFTTMINTYARYNVISSTISVDVANNDTDDPVFLVIFPTRESTAIGIAQNDIVIQQPLAKHALIANQGGTGRVVHYQLTKDMFGFRDSDDINLNAAYNANPTSMWYWHVYIYNLTGANALASTVSVNIRYYCKMSYLRNLSFDVN